MADKKYITTVIMTLAVKEWEFEFPLSAERRDCANFIREWVKFVRNPDARAFDCADFVRVKLHGVFSGGDFLQDGVETTTSAVFKVEKISQPEEKTFAAWFKSWLFWPKRVDQVYRFTTENGSMFTVRSKDAAEKTRNQLWTSRFGAPDEMHYRGSFA